MKLRYFLGEYDTQLRCFKWIKKVKITRNNEY